MIVAVAAALLMGCGGNTTPTGGGDGSLTGVAPTGLRLRGPVVSTPLNTAWVDPLGQAWTGGELGILLHFDGESWRPETLPTTNSRPVTAIWGSGLDNVYVAQQDQLFHYGGDEWETLPSPGRDIYDIHGVGEFTAAISQDGYAFVLSPSGRAPQQTGTATLSALHVFAPDNIIAVGDEFIVHYNGNNWTRTTAPGDVSRLNGVWGRDDGVAYAVGRTNNDEGIVIFFDGTGWSVDHTSTVGPLLDVYGIADEVFATTTRGSVLHRKNGLWREETVTTGDTKINGIGGNASGDVVAVGHSGIISHLSGSKWEEVPHTSNGWFYAAWAQAPRSLFVTGENKLFYHYDGIEFKSSDPPSDVTILDMYGVNSTQAYAVSMKDGKVLLISFRGAWISYSLNYTFSPKTVWAATDDDVFIGGQDGNIIRWNGITTTQMTTNSTYQVNDLMGSSGDDVYAACDEVVLHWDGQAWSRVSLPALGVVRRSFTGVWSSGRENVYIVGREDTYPNESAIILHYDGSAWTVEDLPKSPGMYAVWGTSPSNILAMGDAGATLHFNGAEWQALERITTQRITSLSGAANEIFGAGTNESVVWFR